MVPVVLHTSGEQVRPSYFVISRTDVGFSQYVEELKAHIKELEAEQAELLEHVLELSLKLAQGRRLQ